MKKTHFHARIYTPPKPKQLEVLYFSDARIRFSLQRFSLRNTCTSRFHIPTSTCHENVPQSDPSIRLELYQNTSGPAAVQAVQEDGTL